MSKAREWPGVGKCPAPGQCKICKCPSPGLTRRAKDKDKDKDKCFIINRAPTDTCVYNDNKDFRAIITDVYVCKIYTTIKQGYI